MFHPSKSNKPRRVLHLCIHCYNSFCLHSDPESTKAYFLLKKICLKDVEDFVVKASEDLNLKERTYDRIDEARKENSSSARKRKIDCNCPLGTKRDGKTSVLNFNKGY